MWSNTIFFSNPDMCRAAYPSTLLTALGQPNFRWLTMDPRTMQAAKNGPVDPSNM